MWTDMRKRKKIIQVPIDGDLLANLDRVAYEMREPRAAVIREACARYITDRDKAEEVRRYVESYTSMPESTVDDQWLAQLAAESWAHLGPWEDAEG